MIQAVKFELILTLQTARTLGLTVQLALLAVARRSDRVAGRARGFTERLASNGCALGNYTFAPVATHTRCLHRDTAWVMCGRRPRCKKNLTFGLRSGASHVSGLFARHHDRWP